MFVKVNTAQGKVAFINIDNIITIEEAYDENGEIRGSFLQTIDSGHEPIFATSTVYEILKQANFLHLIG